MLHVPSHPVERSRFPVIDIHTHLAFSLKSEKGVAMGEERKFLATAEELLEVMDRKNIRTMVNLTGGTGTGLAKSLKRYDEAHPDVSHLYGTVVEPQPSVDYQVPAEIARAKQARAWLKILERLDSISQRPHLRSLIKVDDPLRSDVGSMWKLGLPVAIHVSDPGHSSERIVSMNVLGAGQPSLVIPRARLSNRESWSPQSRLARHPKTSSSFALGQR
jgi:hypothetical protein